MKLAVNKNIAHDILTLQKIYQVTIISDKGLVFMHKNDWQNICGIINEYVEITSDRINKLADRFCLWNECFTVAYDTSEDFSCLAIANFDLFALCCTRCDICVVLLPICDLVHYVKDFDAHVNNNTLGCYVESRGDVLIEVEDN